MLHETFRSTWKPELTRDAIGRYITERRAETYVESNWNSMVIALVEHNLAGMVHWEDDFLHALHVAPALQRRGIGTKLLKRAEEDMAKAGVKSVHVEADTFNLPAQRFYTARGYTEKNRYPDKEWNSGLTTILFEKDLKSSD